MKTIILMTLLFVSQLSFAKVLICKQKSLPIVTDYNVKDNTAVVKFTAEKDLKGFTISTVSGLDGLVVNSKTNAPAQDLKKGESVSISVSFTKPEGQSFIVTYLKAKLNSQEKVQSLAIPVGELSQDQLTERKKNIKSLPSVHHNKSGTQALESETKYHTMKLPE